MTWTVAIVGSTGQLARDLAEAWRDRTDRLLELTHADIEVADPASVEKALLGARPDVIINTAAYHRVDEIETHPLEAFRVNALGALNLARLCRQTSAMLVHISSDYVFSGIGSTPFTEADPIGPANVYGTTKAAGEYLIRQTWDNHQIIRSSSLYGHAGSSGKGGNFVELVLSRARQGERMRIVNDQVMTPTSTADLARQIAALVDKAEPGTFHATSQGETTWHSFALEILKQAGVQNDITAQSTAESGAIASRPAYSVLTNARLQQLGIDLMPDWREGLSHYLRTRALSGQQTS